MMQSTKNGNRDNVWTVCGRVDGGGVVGVAVERAVAAAVVVIALIFAQDHVFRGQVKKLLTFSNKTSS